MIIGETTDRKTAVAHLCFQCSAARFLSRRAGNDKGIPKSMDIPHLNHFNYLNVFLSTKGRDAMPGRLKKFSRTKLVDLIKAAMGNDNVDHF